MVAWAGHEMGVLEGRDASERFALGNRCLVGRSPVAQVRLTALKVSSEHASIYFNASPGHWEVRDLGSRNGTQLNGEALVSGRGTRLARGDELCFGEPEQSFRLVDDGPPGPGARADSGERLRAEQGVLWLGEDESAGACVYLSEDGWVLEGQEGQRLVEHGAVVEALGRTWVLELPPKETVGESPSTVAEAEPDVREPRFQFRVSRDEEQVHLRVDVEGREVDLGVRTHHYLLLMLARRRRQDEERGVALGEAGWVYSDDLARMLALDPEHANVMVFRARTQFRQKGLESSRLIERRPASRQVRFGYSAFDEAPRAG
jgi:hypothetical protein